MKLLFLKRSLSWPLATGHDVHTFHLAKALMEAGHGVELATVNPAAPQAMSGLGLAAHHSLADGNQPLVESPGVATTSMREQIAPRLPWLQQRFLRYWGIEPGWIACTGALHARIRPDVVIAAGLDMLPCLAAIPQAIRVWYAADEYARHHRSMANWRHPQSYRHLFEAAVAGLYERTFAMYVDRIWVVSSDEQRAMRQVSGIHQVDIVANGVDGDFFQPGQETPLPRSCVFWGRLDATPNIEAVEWFVKTIWPGVRREFPDARFSAIGFCPVNVLRELDGTNGVRIVADLADLRPEVRRHALAVMPFVSGGGIKNKLLEAAALGLPIVASPMACGGLNPPDRLPLDVARTPTEWLAALRNLWNDSERAIQQGVAARRWVLQWHSWESAAQSALAPIEEMLTARRCNERMADSEVRS